MFCLEAEIRSPHDFAISGFYLCTIYFDWIFAKSLEKKLSFRISECLVLITVFTTLSKYFFQKDDEFGLH